MTTVIVIIVVLVVLALLGAAFMAAQKRRQEQQRAALQDRFGPEYDRAVDQSGSQRDAEKHLAKVADKRDKLDIRDLDATERGRFTDQWDVVQSRFVDQPAEAVDSAETLISTVMRERGYPVEDFDEQADLVAADHPDVVSEYRAAHEAHERHRSSGSLDTEDLRQAFVHYRTLFVSLVNPETVHPATTATTTGTGTPEGQDGAVRPAAPVRTGVTPDEPSGRSADVADDPAPTTPAATGEAAAERAENRAVLDDGYHPQETR